MSKFPYYPADGVRLESATLETWILLPRLPPSFRHFYGPLLTHPQIRIPLARRCNRLPQTHQNVGPRVHRTPNDMDPIPHRQRIRLPLSNRRSLPQELPINHQTSLQEIVQSIRTYLLPSLPGYCPPGTRTTSEYELQALRLVR